MGVMMKAVLKGLKRYWDKKNRKIHLSFKTLSRNNGVVGVHHRQSAPFCVYNAPVRLSSISYDVLLHFKCKLFCFHHKVNAYLTSMQRFGNIWKNC